MATGKGNTAILVDDHAIVFAGLSMVLEHIGFTEIIVLHPTAPIMKTIQGKSPDLVVLDIDMPVKNGVLLYRTVRQIYPELKIVMFTMNKSPGIITRLLNSGVNGYINKSTPLAQVEYGLLEIISGRNFVDHISASIAYENLKSGISLDALTDREFEVFIQLVKGHSYQEVAQQCNISLKTVGTYRSRISVKIGATSKEQWREIAVAQKLI